MSDDSETIDGFEEWDDLLEDDDNEAQEQKAIYVYFIKKGKFVKIGSSTNPKNRLRTLQTGTNQKLKLIYKTSQLNEKELHAKFERYRDHNEWFYFSKDIKAFIKKDQERDLSFIDELIKQLEELN